ncbi:MAG TPA: kelch repeat-containing protein [Rudaea sp.]|nr:kelch repeat-containing protein [Rudaea sp.]
MTSLLLCAVSSVAGAAGFSPTGNLGEGHGGRFGAGDALLPDGKVLIAGGIRDVNLATAETWDPTTGTFSQTANNLSVGRGYPTTTILANGKILFANGGDYNDGGAAVTAADIFDPTTGMFSATGSTHDARHGSTANLLLSTGKVLVAGGIMSNVQTRLATAELYDPATGTFAYTGSMHEARDIAVAVRLQSGKVLIAGGGDGSGVSLNSTEIYDPATGTFAVGPTMVARRDDATATLLPDGKVLVVAGTNNDICVGTAEIYDPTSNVFTASKSTISPRRFHTATLLPSGLVLIAGGVNSATNANTTNDAQLYDPATDTFTSAGSMGTARYYHTATLLGDGRVLIAGGYNDQGVVETAEIYGPLGDPIFANGFE